jgi:Winged helix DNA-binding domain
MARHALTEPATDHGPADIAGVLCGAHAQVLRAAEFSIGRRIAGATRADVQRALWEDRTLVKTFGPRGTVHLLPTADLPMWTGALSALPSSVPAHPEPVRFSAEQAEEVIAAIGDALADTELTVDELTEAIVDRTGPWAGEETMEAFQDRWPRWRQLTSTAAHRGVLCFGPNRDRKVTYTNPHRWLPGFRPDDGEAALRGLVTRYLYAYGPATPQHFARWLAIPPRRAIALFDELAGELESVELDGAPCWTLADDTATPS